MTRHADYNYRPHQAKQGFIPYIDFAPEWFIDCGPGSASEYLDVREKWPSIKLLGLEPSLIGLEYARKRFPTDAILLPVAIWDRDETVRLHKSHDLLHGTCYSDYAHITEDDTEGRSGDETEVAARSLDSLDVEYGPFSDAILWLDVEGSEWRALKGAKGLFERGAIRAIDVETRPGCEDQIGDLLRGYGFKRVNRYLECETYWDDVWIKNEVS